MAQVKVYDQVVLRTLDQHDVPVSWDLLQQHSPVFRAYGTTWNGPDHIISVDFDHDCVEAYCSFCAAIASPGPWMTNVVLVQRALPMLHYYQTALQWARYVVIQAPTLDAIFQWETLVGTGQWPESLLMFIVDHTLTRDRLHQINLLVQTCTPETLGALFRVIATQPVRFEHGAYEIASFAYQDRLIPH